MEDMAKTITIVQNSEPVPDGWPAVRMNALTLGLLLGEVIAQPYIEGGTWIQFFPSYPKDELVRLRSAAATKAAAAFAIRQAGMSLPAYTAVAMDTTAEDLKRYTDLGWEEVPSWQDNIKLRLSRLDEPASKQASTSDPSAQS